MLNLGFHFYVFIFLATLLLELIFNKEVNWFFVNMKIIQVFLLVCIFMSFKWLTFLGIILVWHYLFWIFFPVYKLHKYKRDERDGFILMLIILFATNIFYVSTNAYLHDVTREYLFRYFNIITIVHVLGTSPFGYYFGLLKPKYQVWLYESLPSVIWFCPIQSDCFYLFSGQFFSF